MIRKGTVQDLDWVERIFDEVLNHEAATVCYTNWLKGKYPTRADAQAALDAGTLYVMEENGLLTGCVNLNQVQPEEYSNISWTIPADKSEVLVIHTLCIPPSCSGKGRAKEFVAFSEALAKKQGYKAIRLDTYEGNLPAATMYPTLGYSYAGKTLFHFQNVIWETLICFEKAVN